MKNRLILILMLAVASAASVCAQQPGSLADRQHAKAEKEKAKAEKEKAKAMKREGARQKKQADKAPQGFLPYKTQGRVYVFGVSQTLGENQVYVTDIMPIDSLSLQPKTKFLPYRSAISMQLQQYTEGVLGQTHQTTSVFFDTNEKKLQKRLARVKRNVLSKAESTLTIINRDQFRFVHPLDMMKAE